MGEISNGFHIKEYLYVHPRLYLSCLGTSPPHHVPLGHGVAVSRRAEVSDSPESAKNAVTVVNNGFGYDVDGENDTYSPM